MLEQNAVVITEKKFACIYACYGQRAFIVTNMHLQCYCQLIKNCFCFKPQEFNLEDMNAQIRQCFESVEWFVQLLGGCFYQESDYPTFLSFGSP